MNLEDFISESLTQIAAGVHKAKGDALKNGLKVGFPLYAMVTSNGISDIVTAHQTNRSHPQQIHFDIAVSVSSEAIGKAGISVLGVDLGISAEGQLKNSTISRIQFSLPAVWNED